MEQSPDSSPALTQLTVLTLPWPFLPDALLRGDIIPITIHLSPSGQQNLSPPPPLCMPIILLPKVLEHSTLLPIHLGLCCLVSCKLLPTSYPHCLLLCVLLQVVASLSKLSELLRAVLCLHSTVLTSTNLSPCSILGLTQGLLPEGC